MVSEQEASKELITRNWSLSHFEGLDRINTALRKLGLSPDQASQLIEAANEIKDADFRVAALDLLELKKRTGRSSKEAEAYIKELDSQIASKEKERSDWTGKIEKAKAEFKDWEQKRTSEKAAFEREQAQNKRILKDDREKLDRELSRNKEVRENVEEAIALKAELKKIGLDLPTFESIVKEIVAKSGISLHIAETLREAVNRLGSLDKAIAERERQEKALKESILNLSAQEREKKEALRRLNTEIASTLQTNREIEEQAKSQLQRQLQREIASAEREKKEILRRLDAEIASRTQTYKELDGQLKSADELLGLLDETIKAKSWQYEFFELFIAMLVTSPSAGESAKSLGPRASEFWPLTALALKIQELAKKGWWWKTSNKATPAEQRTAFMITVMGGYLHSIRCRGCEASFIVNKDRASRFFYCCPVCNSSYTEPDDTFFDLMMSPELGKRLQDTRALLETAKMDPEALRKKLKLIDLLPDAFYKALSEGYKIEWKLLHAAD
jgi:hypothetical protein